MVGRLAGEEVNMEAYIRPYNNTLDLRLLLIKVMDNQIGLRRNNFFAIKQIFFLDV